MKDCIGNELAVGDHVLYGQPIWEDADAKYWNHLKVGIIEAFDNSKALVHVCAVTSDIRWHSSPLGILRVDTEEALAMILKGCS